MLHAQVDDDLCRLLGVGEVDDLDDKLLESDDAVTSTPMQPRDVQSVVAVAHGLLLAAEGAAEMSVT